MSEDNLLFSILIANYNNGIYLEECLESIFKQTYTNWEIIIVDDCSTDVLSHDIYEKYKSHDKIKIYYNKKNKGCGYTKRRCAELATGDICGFVDPDDAITLNAIKLIIDSHIKNELSSLVYSNFNICDEQLRVKKRGARLRKEDINSKVTTTEAETVSHFAGFKNSLYKLTDGIDPDLKRAVDKDLYFKLEEVGPLQYIDESLYNYRIHNGGISTNSNMLKAEYWSWVVKIRMAKRRDLNLELHYENEINKKIDKGREMVKRTNNYKLGYLLLNPIRKVLGFFKDI
ncbi:glycosyltransferase family 2 protein [Psychroserpens sp. Hel_I_66]|uniref:glycosyltransferase family 2 protein n=1 Tax=Psychroserpens sp. Hel_I_66 TaxID=1250004 RepID=UPI000646F599|nr:glycosyltransferase [Psychroserpens sp. Hel_I_66]